MILVGCASSVQKKNPMISSGQRISIPQEKIILERPIPPKIEPVSYRVWLNQGENATRVKEYQRFLEKYGVADIIPNFELLRTARDWQRCGRSEYAVPNRELWHNSISTLKVLKSLVQAKVLTDFTVTSVYRDLPLNECAGGASSSRHLFNSAIDFRIGPDYPQADDEVFIQQTKYKLCQYWSRYGQDLNLGIGLYSSGQIHIDTQGFRTWGADLTRGSSLCSV